MGIAMNCHVKLVWALAYLKLVVWPEPLRTVEKRRK